MRRSLLAVFVMVLASASLGAQADSSAKPERKKGRCSGAPPEAALVAVTPAYRDCEVDKPARRVGSEPRLQFMPSTANIREGCIVVELEMIVDTLGAVEPASVRTRRSDHAEFATAVRDAASELRYQPAVKDGQKVRQVVEYRRAAYMGTVSTSAGGRPGNTGSRCR